jgi:RNA polymerase sigma-70 factor (ECF subfamily)
MTLEVPDRTLHEGSARPPITFRSVFDEHYDYVRNSARRLGVRERDLDDVVHEVFLTVHRKFQDFDPSRPIRPWLFGITFRVALGEKRRLGYVREQLADDEPGEVTDHRPLADEALETEQRRKMVHDALLALDDDKRAVFILHELDGVPVPEVARTLEIPPNTAYSRLRLGREELRMALERMVARAQHPKTRRA